jgi:hypothetical protein
MQLPLGFKGLRNETNTMSYCSGVAALHLNVKNNYTTHTHTHTHVHPSRSPSKTDNHDS